jgi:uncharacterized membrane protein
MARKPRSGEVSPGGATPPRTPKTIPGKTDVSVSFKMAFWSVIGLTVLSLVASFAMVFLRVDTAEAKSLIETCNTTWKMGVAAILGLLAGRNLQ